MEQFEDRACLTGENLIQTPHGLKRMDAIAIGDRVLGISGRWCKVIRRLRKTWTDGRMTTIDYVGNDQALKCTFDHEVWICRKGSNTPAFIPAHTILPSDSVCLPIPSESTTLTWVTIKDSWRIRDRILKAPGSGGRNYKALPNHIAINNEWLFLFGWYAAEGFASTMKGKGSFVSLSGHRKERHILERCGKCFESLGLSCSIYESKTTKGIELRCFGYELASWFMEWFGHTAANKSLPVEIKSLPQDQAKHVLDGYIAGDGYERKAQREWASASRQLCFDFCMLAAKCGYAPTIRYREGQTSLCRGKEVKGNGAWIGGYSTTTQTKKPFIKRKVRSVQNTWERRPYVYDIEVDQDESFTAGFAAVHNCRIGQEYSVLCQTIVVDGGFDAYLAQLLAGKQIGINSVLNTNLDEEKEELQKMADFVKDVASGEDPLAQEVRGRISDPLAKALNIKKGLEVELGFISKKPLQHRHSPGQRQRMLQGLRKLSAWCDGANAIDGKGFSKFDTGFGCYLAEQEDLTAQQSAAAEKMIRKYHRQLGADFLQWPAK